MRRLRRGVSDLTYRLPSRVHRHVSESSRAQLTSVVEIIYMDSPDGVDWREVCVAARPTLQRCDGSHGARHAGRPVEISRLSQENYRMLTCSLSGSPRLLLLHGLLLALAREIE
jgi:hypothetical protein